MATAVTAPQTQTVIGYPEASSCVIDFSIPNFSSLKAQTTAINSEKVAMCGAVWYIDVLALLKGGAWSGKVKSDCDWVAAFVNRETEGLHNGAEHKVKYSITVMESAGNGGSQKTSRCVKGDRIFDVEYLGWGSQEFIKHSEIWGANPTVLLANDILKLRAEVQCLLLTTETKLRSSVADTLHNRIRLVFESEVGRDLVLV